MSDEFSRFLDSPGANTYLALRDVIYGSDVFDMSSNALLQLEEAVREERFDDVPAIQDTLMPNFLLCTRAHALLGKAADARGETERAVSEMRMAEACSFGMRSTGDGSRLLPYHVMHPADGYDLALVMEREVVDQRSEGFNGNAFDVLTCSDESEIWLDMTKSATAMAQRAMLGA